MSNSRTQHKTILIADDHPIFRQGLRQIVESLSWLKIVAEADTGEATLTQIKYHQPDLIILDIAMPGMDGLEVLRHLGATDDRPAVIIVTSYDDKAYLDRAMELNVRAYVLKDSASEDLANCLEAVSRGELYISPSLGSHTVRLPQLGQTGPEVLEALTPMERTVLAQVAEYKTSKARERHQVQLQRRSPHPRRAPCRHDLGSAAKACFQHRHRGL